MTPRRGSSNSYNLPANVWLGLVGARDASNVGATNAPGHQRTNAIVPVLFGVSYSPRALAISTSLRPFVSVAAGPYVHTVADVSPLTETASTETAPGARFGTGVNWYVARHFMLQVEADYHAIGHFDHPDALTQKPSGFGLSAGFGIGWGGR